RSYLALTESSSAAERRANGIAWNPIAIRGSEIGRGEYLTVEIERTTHQELAHQLRFGAAAALFSNHNPKDRVEGTITHQSGNKLKITLKTDELPDWARDGKLGIDVLFDNNSYNEMQNALKQASDSTDNPEQKERNRLIKILTGQVSPNFSSQIPHQVIPELNETQQLAVDNILSAQEL